MRSPQRDPRRTVTRPCPHCGRPVGMRPLRHLTDADVARYAVGRGPRRTVLRGLCPRCGRPIHATNPRHAEYGRYLRAQAESGTCPADFAWVAESRWAARAKPLDKQVNTR